MKFLGDILGVYQPLSKKSSRSERNELVKFFVEHIVDQSGKPYRPAFMAVRLSHYTLSDLYALKSGFNDRLKRDGIDSARKFWWFTTKTTKATVDK